MSVTVWSRSHCGPCIAVKAALRAGGVAYAERDLDSATGADRARWASRGMQGMSAPVVEYAGGVFAGFIPARVRAVVDAH